MLAFILIVQKIEATEESKNDCDYSKPTEKCECTKFLDSKNQCVDKCPEGEYIFKYQDISKFKQCATCKSKDLYTSIKLNICVNDCGQDEIIDEEYKICLVNEKDCKGYVKENKCYQCKENELIDRKNKKCLQDHTECGGIKIEKECIYCKDDEITDLLSLQCLKEDDICLGIIKDRKCQGCGDKIIFENKCITEEECKGFIYDITNAKLCIKECPKEFFTFNDSKKCSNCDQFIIDKEKSICSSKCEGKIYQILDEENNIEQKYCDLKKCPEGYYQVSKEGDNVIKCSSKCNNKQILDTENQICIEQKNECKKFISSDEKQCVDKCGENEFVEVEEGAQQCKECEEIIREETKDNIKSIKCVTKCEEGELIYEFGDNNQYNKCIQTSQCVNRKISSDKKYCSEKCANNELVYENECVQKCPQTSFYSEDKKSCLKECPQGQYIKSNGRQCLNNCNQVYEIVDEEGKKCLKCKENEQFTYENSKGVCKEANSAQQVLLNIKNFFQNEQNKIADQDFESHILKPIQTLTSQNENKINQIISKKQKDEKDIASISETLNQQKQMVFELLNLVKPEYYDKSIVLGQDDLKITAQAQVKGYKFKTKFISDEIAEHKTTILIEESEEKSELPVFNPTAMILTYMKQNYLCKDSECKNTHPLFTISYIESQSQRILADVQAKPQEFEMEYKINSSNKTNQLLCLSYDQKGSITRQPIIVKADKAFCKFNYSTSLLFDETCVYVDKIYCSQKIENTNQKSVEDKTQNEQNTISLAKIFFIIGLLGLLLIYFLRKDNKNHKPEQRSKARIQYDDDEQMMEDMEQHRRRYPKQI
ncbi:transmembrane protein, putative (macronuclear) [Tetrahymena thermophila SB210]|uniref:Transmembrane protein, putative n=1 Tax=Tetrahymena thermophila (strain SB210) TaxID=312017 RepID=Q228A8_TETTS|nr:transmembrane protein, putative [Tetrahymena thermophila SB210]EAR81624.2 transmembrane protein, putative [Tetrahymena thermophila SB210]|eukprot:XP_001029287.2 transmembrane protein, putative [Tetrahymena thermophila SB210]